MRDSMRLPVPICPLQRFVSFSAAISLIISLCAPRYLLCFATLNHVFFDGVCSVLLDLTGRDIH